MHYPAPRKGKQELSITACKSLSILKEKAQFSFHFAWMKLLTAMHLNSVSSRIREGIAGCVFLQGTLGTFGSLVGAAEA